MRIIVVGATGTIGSAVVAALSAQHEVVSVGHKSGAIRVDLASIESIIQMFRTVEAFDALLCAAGRAAFGSLDDLKDADFQLGLSNKLMGQVNLVRIGRQYIHDNGSFTLTSGVLSREPMKGSASISMVNAGLEGFARAAALELPRGIRINVVSPPWVTETLIARKMDPSIGLPAATVAQTYLAGVEGTATGQTLDPRTFSTGQRG
ncbi:MAG: short chain dehydrogenase [Nitrospira sp.]|nr:short chain dehydrogenase [Nitrospira sp.]